MKRYETRDIRARDVFVSALVMVVTAIFIFFVVGRGVKLTKVKYMPDLTHENSLTPPPPPQLEVKEKGEYAAFKTQEDQLLNSYGWVDRANGRVRVPIDRAMEIYLERNAP